MQEQLPTTCMNAEGTTPRMEEVESRPEQRSRAPKVGALATQEQLPRHEEYEDKKTSRPSCLRGDSS